MGEYSKLCPWCGRLVVFNEAELRIAHELPECAQFSALLAVYTPSSSRLELRTVPDPKAEAAMSAHFSHGAGPIVSIRSCRHVQAGAPIVGRIFASDKQNPDSPMYAKALRGCAACWERMTELMDALAEKGT